jgi:sulfite reductase alpha subunit-like flavoprotein
MAKDVEATLKAILAKHTPYSDNFLKQMRKDKRYMRDVY